MTIPDVHLEAAARGICRRFHDRYGSPECRCRWCDRPFRFASAAKACERYCEVVVDRGDSPVAPAPSRGPRLLAFACVALAVIAVVLTLTADQSEGAVQAPAASVEESQ